MRYLLAATPLAASEDLIAGPTVGSGYLYLRRRAPPLLRLPIRVVPFPTGDPLAVIEGAADWGQQALVSDVAPWQARRPQASRLFRDQLELARAAVRVELAERRLLASGIFQDGNWHVLVDGQPGPETVVNGIFVGAWLDRGAHRVVLLYRPLWFVIGGLLAALGAALALALALALPAPVRSSRAAGAGW